MPIVIKSWNSETNRPRIWEGEISAMYNGTEKEEMPMAKPINKRAAIKDPGPDAQPDQLEPSTKILAALIFVFFLPKMSDNLPVNIAPRTAPANPAVVIFSTMLLLRWKSC